MRRVVACYIAYLHFAVGGHSTRFGALFVGHEMRDPRSPIPDWLLQEHSEYTDDRPARFID